MVDVAEVFLWLMAVGTILGASFWSAWSAKEASLQHYRRVKVWTVPILNTHLTVICKLHPRLNINLGLELLRVGYVSLWVERLSSVLEIH